MSFNMSEMRSQILENARYMTCASLTPPYTSDTTVKFSGLGSVSTLVTPTSGHAAIDPQEIQVVIFGDGNQFTAAVMCGIHPALQGASGPSPEMAMRKLLLATCEYLNTIMPKVGDHQRNIHGGGVVDEDYVSRDLLDKKV